MQFRKEKHVIGLMHSLVLPYTQTCETLIMRRQFDHFIDGAVGTELILYYEFSWSME